MNTLKRLKIKANAFFGERNRSTIVELTRAKFKARDHNSVLGVSGSLMGPLVLTLAMYLIFRARFGHRIEHYPLYLLLGVSTVSFFISSSTNITSIFVTSRRLVLNSMVLRESLIVSSLIVAAYKFIAELIVCCGLSLFFGVFSWKSLLLLLPLLVGYLAFILGVVLILSLLYCYLRDVGYVWLVVTRLLFFITPIFYTLDSVSPLVRGIVYWFNPLTPFLISFQRIFLNMGNVDMGVYIHSIVLGVAFFILGYSFFIVFEQPALEKA